MYLFLRHVVYLIFHIFQYYTWMVSLNFYQLDLI
jgi:hypothetical protein